MWWRPHAIDSHSVDDLLASLRVPSPRHVLRRVLDAEDGVIEKGSIHLFGHAIESAPAPSIVQRGMVQVPEGRRVFLFFYE